MLQYFLYAGRAIIPMLKIIPMNFFISSTSTFFQLFQADLLLNCREALITLSAYSFVFFTKFSTKFLVKIKLISIGLDQHRMSICRDINLHTWCFSEWKIFDSRRLFTPIFITVTQLSGAWGYCCSSEASTSS